VKKNNGQSLGGMLLVDAIVKSAKDKLAEQIIVLDIRKLPGTADFFVICQSDNGVHNRAIADTIINDLADLDTRPWHAEGLEDGRWVLVDYSDVVVHIMLPEVRSYYNLEGLWAAAETVKV
jgi:ribosome-associated protein